MNILSENNVDVSLESQSHTQTKNVRIQARRAHRRRVEHQATARRRPPINIRGTRSCEHIQSPASARRSTTCARHLFEQKPLLRNNNNKQHDRPRKGW